MNYLETLNSTLQCGARSSKANVLPALHQLLRGTETELSLRSGVAEAFPDFSSSMLFGV